MAKFKENGKLKLLIIVGTRPEISVEESDDPWVTLNLEGYGEFRFKASDKREDIDTATLSEVLADVPMIIETVHQAYIIANKTLF